jgi:hypothetical protein
VSREIWKAIPGFHGYEASSNGRIRSNDRVDKYGKKLKGKLLSQIESHYGYLVVNPNSSCQYVHRLVLLAFSGEAPNGHECCHNDGDKKNNGVINLRWDSRASNIADRVDHGSASIKLSRKDVRAIRALANCPRKQIADRFGVTTGTINKIISRALWANV